MIIIHLIYVNLTSSSSKLPKIYYSLRLTLLFLYCSSLDITAFNLDSNVNLKKIETWYVLNFYNQSKI